MVKKRIGVLLVVHGSKRNESNAEFIRLCENIRTEKSSEFESVEYAFLEFACPSIESAVKNMYEKNISTIYIYPYFLNSGKHVIVDIPDKVSALQKTYPKIEIEILKHFGSSKNVETIISKDLDAIL